MELELRVYDVDGVKRFIKVNPEIFIESFQRQLKERDFRTFNPVLETAISEATIDNANESYYQSPRYFTIEVLNQTVEHRDYEIAHHKQNSIYMDKVNTRFGALIEKIGNMCYDYLNKG